MAEHPIPAMIDPMGIYWLQPKLEEIAVDATHAVMDLSSFTKLSEYSTTTPSGVYPGKMWKRRIVAPEAIVNDLVVPRGTWVLCWYGPLYPEGHEWFGSVSNEYRIILITS